MWICPIKTDSEKAGGQLSGGRLGSRGTEQKGKRTHGHACTAVWGLGRGEVSIGGLKCNGKNTIKIKKNKVYLLLPPPSYEYEQGVSMSIEKQRNTMFKNFASQVRLQGFKSWLCCFSAVASY